MTRPHDAQTPRIEAWIREHKSDMTEHFFLASTEIMRQLERELQAERERGRRVKEETIELRNALLHTSRNCEHLHHGKGQYHEATEACPVEAIIKAALSRAESAPEGGKQDVPTVREE